MKTFIRGMMIGSIASVALYNMKPNRKKSVLKKGKKAVEKKLNDIF